MEELNGDSRQRYTWKDAKPFFLAFLVTLFIGLALFFQFSDNIVTRIVPYKQIQQGLQQARYPLESPLIMDSEYRKISITVGKERFLAICPDEKALIETREVAENKGYTVIGKINEGSGWAFYLMTFVPVALFVFLMIVSTVRGASNKTVFGLSKNKTDFRYIKTDITFADVVGVDEAKAELEEIVNFLKNPDQVTKIGAKIPKGVLLVGAPGTGKTLLARAVAGEAGVPFCPVSGSDFMEAFVGVGASRIRELFQQAQQHSPAIIFIDEIDAVGSRRSAMNVNLGHNEQGLTLNALLAEMDGFNNKQGIIVVGATNRPEILDPALLRPGRFDRQAILNKPDVRGRLGILQVHTKNIVLADDIDLETIAKVTPNFSGADLANLANEAALHAACQGKEMVQQEDFEFAKDKIVFGGREMKRVMDLEEKRLTAIHEAGHTFVAHYCQHADPVHKVTIIPRGLSLGATLFLPEKDRFLMTEDQAEDRLKVLLGGRAAELIIAGQKVSGAVDDITRATQLARRMICEWGMSSRLGTVKFGQTPSNNFLDSLEFIKDFSEETGRLIDQEKRCLIEEALREARMIIENHKDRLLQLVDLLMEKETVEGEELRMILEG